MFGRIFSTALGAGLAVGLLMAALQHVALVPLILKAETYERGTAEPHTHTGVIREDLAVAPLVTVLMAPAHAHDPAAAAVAPQSPWRAVWTTVATTLTSVGFALFLVGAFAVSGREVKAREGVLWGVAGFAAFALAPAFGLPPELPGAAAADLLARQTWWVGSVAATAAGLGLLVFGRAKWAALAIALIAVPHLIGAPHPDSGAGTAPPELAATFAARSLAVGAVFWAVLGLACGALYARLGRQTA